MLDERGVQPLLKAFTPSTSKDFEDVSLWLRFDEAIFYV
jgi:hypothetical protein